MIKYYLFLFIVFAAKTNFLIAQTYDSIKICHTKAGDLHSIKLGMYEMEFQSQRLNSFIFEKGIIRYSANQNDRLEFNSPSAPNFLIERRDSGMFIEGVLFKGVIKTLASVGINAKEGSYDVFQPVDTMHIIKLLFQDNRLVKISFPFKKMSVYITCNYDKNKNISPDFLFEGNDSTNSVMVSSLLGLPHIISIRDKDAGSGISIFYSYKGFIESIHPRFLSNGNFIFDGKHYIKYNKRGILKRNYLSNNNACDE